MDIVIIFVLAIIVEALVEYGKLLFTKAGVNWKQIAAVLISIGLAFAAQADLFKLLGIPFIVPYLGIVLTGIIFSRGANYLADFIKLIQTKILEAKGGA